MRREREKKRQRKREKTPACIFSSKNEQEAIELVHRVRMRVGPWKRPEKDYNKHDTLKEKRRGQRQKRSQRSAEGKDGLLGYETAGMIIYL